MRYVGGEAPETGCVFCQRLAADDDVRSLILRRGVRTFAIMNLFPYNIGHLMLVPTQHVASPEEADLEALREMAGALPSTLRALRRVLGCNGFNVGFNVGADAGAGVADHLHQHVVPRWEGDANFMPILAATMVLPELIPVTYAKIRAELGREATGTNRVACVAFDADRRVLAERRDDGWRLPVAVADVDEPLWRAARRRIASLSQATVNVLGWAGTAYTADNEALALTLEVESDPTGRDAPSADLRWTATDEASLLGEDASTVTTARARLAPLDTAT